MNKEKTNAKLVTVATVNQLSTATLLKTLLENAGIMVFLQDVTMSQLYSSVTTGGIRIQVLDTEMEKACNLLVENGYENMI
ncbi:MAG: DUF2007 domain-containing protein [Bacteroidales bacterium]|jgi:hypothetical protein|nr:DUF2007 domain-containing protein [Bacteroidales bacterium]